MFVVVSNARIEPERHPKIEFRRPFGARKSHDDLVGVAALHNYA
jgi:hypothetical protein